MVVRDQHNNPVIDKFGAYAVSDLTPETKAAMILALRMLPSAPRMSIDQVLQRKQHEAPQRERQQQQRGGHADARAAQHAPSPGDRPTRL
jgi:uncharacterized iron-regulated protein